jgi:hypothetical protein
VTFRKLIAFLVGLCVLLAPVLSNAALPMPSPMVHADGHGADCHGLAPQGDDADQPGTHAPASKASHSCCFNFVGILPAADPLPPPHGAGARIPFSPRLGLAFRMEGVYRPPWQVS